MKYIKNLAYVGLLVVGLSACTTVAPPTQNVRNYDLFKAAIVKEGFIDCFEENLQAGGKPVWCEASAVLYDGKKVFVANDKNMPAELSSIYYFANLEDFGNKQAQNMGKGAFLNGTKYEDAALTPDGKTAFMITAFDRVKPGSTEWDNFNTVYYWTVGKEDQPNVLAAKEGQTSVSLRQIFSKVITSSSFPDGNVPYFKIEGLAATDSYLYFAVRESGKKYDDFEYQVQILAIPYFVIIENGQTRIELKNSCEKVADFKPSSVSADLVKPLGVSSIEYDRFNDRFLVLTSYEQAENFGGYLWSITENDLRLNKPFTLVKDESGNPLKFTHKAEDLTFLAGNKILVIHDDDRTTIQTGDVKRKPHQAAYSVVEFK
jgi:hypothetical protein